MNEMLIDALAFQRYHDDVKRGEANYQRQATIAAQNNGLRARLAITLVGPPARLQPELGIAIQQPAQPAAA
jgi:hypothetical protein